VHADLPLWVSFFVFILFVTISFARLSLSDWQLHAFIFMFDLQFCASSSLTSSFLRLLDALRLNLSLRKKNQFCGFLYICDFQFCELIFGKSVQLRLFIFVCKFEGMYVFYVCP